MAQRHNKTFRTRAFYWIALVCGLVMALCNSWLESHASTINYYWGTAVTQVSV